MSQRYKTCLEEHRDNKQTTFIAVAPKVLVDLKDGRERKLRYRMTNGESEYYPFEEEYELEVWKFLVRIFGQRNMHNFTLDWRA